MFQGILCNNYQVMSHGFNDFWLLFEIRKRLIIVLFLHDDLYFSIRTTIWKLLNDASIYSTVKIFFASQRILSLAFSFKDFFIIIQYLVRYINFHLKCATFFCYAERNLNLKLKSGEGFGVSQLTRKAIKQSPESSGDVRLLNLWPYSFWDLISLKHKWKWLLLGVCVCMCVYILPPWRLLPSAKCPRHTWGCGSTILCCEY